MSVNGAADLSNAYGYDALYRLTAESWTGPRAQSRRKRDGKGVGRNVPFSAPGFIDAEMLGPIGMIAGAAIDLSEVAKSDTPVQTGLEKGGGWGGMLIGSELGAAAGFEFAGPPGAVAGSMLGAGIGYFGGEKAVHETLGPVNDAIEMQRQIDDYKEQHDIRSVGPNWGPAQPFIDNVRIQREYERNVEGDAPLPGIDY